MNDDDLKEYVAASFEYDWMTLLDIVAYFHENAAEGADPTAVLLQGAAAARLVRDGAMIPGGIGDAGFEPWASSPEESADRIEAETAELASRTDDLRIGEIAWFTAPENFPR